MHYQVREAVQDDEEAIWSIFRAVVAEGETYAFPRDIARDEALRYWVQHPARGYVVADADDLVLGTYTLKPNQQGPGSHVCNCGYMVGPQARRKGLATLMCEHSQSEAKRLGFKAMQFNLVVSTNEGAVHLWKQMGFDIVGTLPKAYDHAKLGFVDAYVMYKWF